MLRIIHVGKCKGLHLTLADTCWFWDFGYKKTPSGAWSLFLRSNGASLQQNLYCFITKKLITN